MPPIEAVTTSSRLGSGRDRFSAGPSMSDLTHKRDRLLQQLRSYGSCAVAFSAGVDSSVLAKAAQLALGDRAVAVTASSPSLASGELDQARALAEQMGIRHVVIETQELDRPGYAANEFDRCYHCKSELYGRLEDWIDRLGVQVVVNGANVDDLGDHRPGLRAAEERQVASPLADCGFHKNEIRELAAEWGLPVWDKPATPCLSSRIAYGEEVTEARLRMIDQAELWLRQQGFTVVRVRYHRGDVARIEVEASQLERLCQPDVRERLVRYLQSLGFQFVSVDLAGFRSGSLNTLVPVDQLERSS